MRLRARRSCNVIQYQRKPDALPIRHDALWRHDQRLEGRSIALQKRTVFGNAEVDNTQPDHLKLPEALSQGQPVDHGVHGRRKMQQTAPICCPAALGLDYTAK